MFIALEKRGLKLYLDHSREPILRREIVVREGILERILFSLPGL